MIERSKSDIFYNAKCLYVLQLLLFNIYRNDRLNFSYRITAQTTEMDKVASINTIFIKLGNNDQLFKSSKYY